MEVYGLLGRSLSHSFSKNYFEKKFRELNRTAVYRNFELEHIEGFPALMAAENNLRGLNVTYPYKEAVIPYLDDLSPEAAEIAAVNCISVKNGRTTGYNTDVYGFLQSVKPFLDRNHERALVLGTGGAAKAVAFGLKKFNIPVFFVTSDAAKKKDNVFLYSEVNERFMSSCKLLINCTPLGMHPQEDRCPDLPYGHLTPEHLVYDLIYNPAETLFLKKAKAAGAVTVNGLSMLHLQAEKSWEIWNS